MILYVLSKIEPWIQRIFTLMGKDDKNTDVTVTFYETTMKAPVIWDFNYLNFLEERQQLLFHIPICMYNTCLCSCMCVYSRKIKVYTL